MLTIRYRQDLPATDRASDTLASSAPNLFPLLELLLLGIRLGMLSDVYVDIACYVSFHLFSEVRKYYNCFKFLDS